MNRRAHLEAPSLGSLEVLSLACEPCIHTKNVFEGDDAQNSIRIIILALE